MKDLKVYAEWCPIIEKETGLKILDNDGGRALAIENRTDTLLTKEEAYCYFYRNTVIGMPKNS